MRQRGQNWAVMFVVMFVIAELRRLVCCYMTDPDPNAPTTVPPADPNAGAPDPNTGLVSEPSAYAPLPPLTEAPPPGQDAALRQGTPPDPHTSGTDPVEVDDPDEIPQPPEVFANSPVGDTTVCQDSVLKHGGVSDRLVHEPKGGDCQ